MSEVLSQQVHGRWTMFLPNNDAFAKLSSYKLRQLANDKDAAVEFAKYGISNWFKYKISVILYPEKLCHNVGLIWTYIGNFAV